MNSDCGQPNSLVQLSTHLSQDRAFSDSHGQLLSNSSADQLVEQFLQETRSLPQTFRMDGLMREMQEIESQKLALPPVPASAVKEQIQQDNVWAKQYIDDGKTFNPNFDHSEIWAEISSQERNIIGPHSELLKFDQQFELNQNRIEESAEELLGNVDDPKFVYSKFMSFMQNVKEEDINLEASGRLTEREAEIWSHEFLKNAKGRTMPEIWAAELTANEDDYNSNVWGSIQEQIRNVVETDGDLHGSWLSELQDETYEHYNFTEENPMFDVNNPLESGKKLLAEGDLPSAVLCFEAAVKKSPTDAEAWFYLGRTQAENEQDTNAIPALKQCLKLDSGHLPALMALSVSYTNENLYNQACETLLCWLKNNPKYTDLVPPDFILTGMKSKMVQDIFIKAAQRHPVNIDYEVQCALGVLFNLSGDFDKAVDCFKAALAVKPDDARLWNRLGATLANGSRSEEAVEAYHRALSLSPGFIRARYNVGITCINLNAYKQAAEHFLTALNQQARGEDITNSGGKSQMSDTIWSTLKMCVTLMKRTDLKPAIEAKDLATLNKALDVMDEPTV
ncbi:peroxisomal targeting signal 1 receptor isoform X2 [Coccinella septempunctata]|uniref:peroxisomal targeting signal 1 receptor isoform X2 n=1 Tax=Coccinella septempunctata TaxID=41139 RepID=UPI001D084993|nr:peroxisomal targeting signal 1 receptor isoform X2 [Coccinella septempunctata]